MLYSVWWGCHAVSTVSYPCKGRKTRRNQRSSKRVVCDNLYMYVSIPLIYIYTCVCVCVYYVVISMATVL